MYRGLVPSRTSETFGGCKQYEHAGLQEEAAADCQHPRAWARPSLLGCAQLCFSAEQLCKDSIDLKFKSNVVT